LNTDPLPLRWDLIMRPICSHKGRSMVQTAGAAGVSEQAGGRTTPKPSTKPAAVVLLFCSELCAAVWPACSLWLPGQAVGGTA
jgi:hypothetical protein